MIRPSTEAMFCRLTLALKSVSTQAFVIERLWRVMDDKEFVNMGLGLGPENAITSRFREDEHPSMYERGARLSCRACRCVD
ncbi:hypothetical protein BKA70DRAFT_1332536 [Coprinopsis sp. MPI-PUGE-AT-0042]|nr:hypothetical protein BKA70DRAFT_1332536 [Coprinopsis sp. MPI-PUGE-AT-0042]